uniref:Si:ch211-241e1.3 n=1 Tax=Amphilophus citrinellus TaxID=61819 RepID=A0A3Q0SFF0_AMPCI
CEHLLSLAWQSCLCICAFLFQKCAPGYYRDGSSPYLGRCVPCECNGLSDECEESTGRCLNCQYNTAGDRCERCKEGYYGDAALRTCKACPCPFTAVTKNFAVGCREVYGDIQCICRTGYTGSRCERCAPGYYGDPLVPGGSCRPCNCVGNGNSCDPRTGGDLKERTEALWCDVLFTLNRLDDELGKIKARLDNATAISFEAQLCPFSWHWQTLPSHSRLQCVYNWFTSLYDFALYSHFVCVWFYLLEALLGELANQDGRGDTPSGNLAKMLEEAQGMVDEMENKNFTPQKTAAEKERDEAKKCTTLRKSTTSLSVLMSGALRGHLEDYEAKLKELDKALKDAVDLLEKANAQNGLNAETIGDMQVTKKYKEYEQLAAQLDGAKTDLTKKVNEISKAVAQKDIVEAAEDHAKNLQKIAKDLEEYVTQMFNGIFIKSLGRTEVRDAKDAIEAYKNITDAINAAEAAAKEAKDAADNALDSHGYRINIKLIYGCIILNYFCFRILYSPTDDIGAMIDSAKQKAASANQTASNTMDRLSEIRKEINKISVSPGSSNLGGILDNVNQSVTNLLETISTLDDKISVVENLTSQVSPISNISENIKMLKDLIEQARDAANMIAIPMMFQGSGYVELHPPKNLDDLKAYTAISLMLQRPEGRGDGKRRRRQAGENDMFVLYLGNRDSSKNYIGMVLRSNELYGVYKLNGAEYTMKTGAITKSKNEPAIFDRVDLNRIYQDAELILTKGTDSSAVPTKIGNQGQESENLLDVSPNDIVFYVGGYPANFTPPVSLRYPKYKGCIEISSVNNKDLSLYNFKRRQNINEATPYWTDVKVILRAKKDFVVYVEGSPVVKFPANFDMQTGFDIYIGGVPLDLRERHNITMRPFRGCLKNLKLEGTSIPFDEIFFFLVFHRPHFSLEVRTRSHEGMLFFAATRGGQSHLALYMSKGRIRLSVGKQKIFNREKYNDGKWHTIMFSLEKKKFRLVVDGIRAQDGQLTNAELSSMKQHFLSPSKGLPKQSVSGCMRNFKMNGALMSNPTTNHGAGPCFEGQTQRGAYFSGDGAHVVVNDSFVVGSTFELLFNIRPRSLTGLLLHVGVHSKTQNGPAMGHYLTIYMLRGEVRPNICFLFTILVLLSSKVLGIRTAVSWFFLALSYLINEIFVFSPILPVTSSFVGCIQDMRINGEPVSFERPSGVFGPINLKECPS